MPSEPRKGLPSFWCTGIAKALSGEQPCPLTLWLSGHTVLEKRIRDDQGTLAAWKANHSAMLATLVERLQREGWKVKKEAFFRVAGQTAILAGKADAVTQAPDRRPKVWDTKSGQPSDSDVTQVLIEMVMLPLAWGSPEMLFDGAVVYDSHTVELKPSDAERIKPQVFAKLREMARAERPAAAPSRDACRFCDCTKDDCAERFVEAPDATTLEF